MSNPKKYRCIECNALFDDYQLTSDMLFCPSCGGHLEEGSFKENDRTESNRTSEEKTQDRNFEREEPHQTYESRKKRLHTHYENLKVARNAPPEVIRAAYRVLAQKYHPDCNPGNDEAIRIMKIINISYDILSDPTKRREHDQWIEKCERTYEEPVRPVYQPRPEAAPRPAASPRPAPTPRTSTTSSGSNLISHVLRNWLWYSIAVFVLWGMINDKTRTPQLGPKPYQASPAPAKPTYVPPNSAPNGQPWPSYASYITGYPQLNTNGLSKVTIDNSQNDSSVFIKLVSLSGTNAYPVRTFYIPASGRFTLLEVDAGKYDIRYRNLSTGGLSRSQAFDLEETPTGDGTQFSNITMTLYKVRNGNMQTYSLPENEF